MRILFVCTGNTCRSPMAEELLRCMAKELELDDLEVQSAGTDARSGDYASFGACNVIAARGGDLFGHTARLLTRGRIEDADLILTMSQAHKEKVIDLCAEAKDKTFTLLSYATGQEGEIADPFGGDENVYMQTLDQIELALVVLLIRLYPERAEEIRSVYSWDSEA